MKWKYKIIDEAGFIPLLACAFVFIVMLLAGVILASLGIKPDSNSPSNFTGSTDTVSVLGNVKMPALEGKLGHEDHLFPSNRGGIGDIVSGDPTNNNCISNKIHYVGDDSKEGGNIITAGGCGAFGSGMKTEEERWYFNMQWEYDGHKEDYRHKKVIITNPANGKRIVVSIEETGPAQFVTDRDGINAGAPPEVYRYLELENPYTGNPNDKKGFVHFGLAADQSIPLGPLI